MRTISLPEQSERVETGPVKFGEDWTGLFIRGDHCMAYAGGLEQLLKEGATFIPKAYVEGLLELLKEAEEHRDQEVRKDLLKVVANDRRRFAHVYKSRTDTPGTHKINTRFYDKLEDIPCARIPHDPDMFDEEVYDLSKVPWFILHEVRRKVVEDREYKRYLELKQKFEPQENKE